MTALKSPMELPEKQDEKKPYILLKYAEQKYLVPMGDTPAGNARRVINALKDFQKLADQDKEHLDKVVSRKEELQNLVRSPDHSYSDQLAACEKEASRLREQIAVRAECGALRISAMCACFGILWPVFAPRHLVL